MVSYGNISETVQERQWETNRNCTCMWPAEQRPSYMGRNAVEWSWMSFCSFKCFPNSVVRKIDYLRFDNTLHIAQMRRAICQRFSKQEVFNCLTVVFISINHQPEY